MARVYQSGVGFVDRPRDSQRKKLYNWERELFGNSTQIKLSECKQLIDNVFTDYGISPPEIGDGRGRRHAGYGPSGYRYSPRERVYHHTGQVIKLPRWARTRWITLHECAHGLVDHKYQCSVAPHGPEFLSVYIDLLTKHLEQSRDHLRETARLARLAVA